MQAWAAEELRYVDLGDRRLNKRLIRMVEALAAQPSTSVPQSCGSWAATKAAYRFWDSERVEPANIQESHIQSTLERVRHHRRILAVQDTTELNYAHHPATTEDLGPLDNAYQNGFKVHSTLAVSTEGVPLGLLHQQIWVRDPEAAPLPHRRKRPIADKESQRWLTAWTKSQDHIAVEVSVVTVADSEADIYDLFTTPRRHGADLLIRGTHNRRVEAQARYLWQAVWAQPLRGHATMALRGRNGEPGRTVRLRVRTTTVTIEPPRHHLKRAQCVPVILNVILVEEIYPPRRGERITWLLLTTLPIQTWEDLRAAIRWYTYRWLIERYHFVYKSGCRLEELQLQNGQRLQRALATYSLVAWRLLWLTYQARQEPEASCEIALEPREWQALSARYLRTTQVPTTPPTLREAVHWIARLGGFLARTADKEPGVQTLWQGLRRLTDLTDMWQLHHPETA
jgi:hypothetical protein